MEITVRKAKEADLKDLQLLGTELMQVDIKFDALQEEQWYFSEEGIKYLLKYIRGRSHVCFVAVDQDKVIGYATGAILKVNSWRPVKRAEIFNLVVTKKYRNHGAGHKLINEFKKWGKHMGVERFKVMTYASNKDAVRFYKDNGFASLAILLETK